MFPVGVGVDVGGGGVAAVVEVVSDAVGVGEDDAPGVEVANVTEKRQPPINFHLCIQYIGNNNNKCRSGI